MADAKENPTGSPPVDQGKPPSGQVVGMAARVAAQHGGGPASARPAKSAPVAGATVNKGGRRTFQEDLAKYLAETGQTVVPVQAANGALVNPVAPPAYVVTPEFVGEVTVTLLKGVEAYRVRSVALRVKTLCGDINLAKEYAESAAAPPGCIETIGKGMTEVAKKYPAMLQWAPEFTVAGALGMWVMKDVDNMKRLDALERRIVEMKKAQVSKVETVKPADATPGSIPSS